jgi:regulator of replication initiation timing
LGEDSEAMRRRLVIAHQDRERLHRLVVGYVEQIKMLQAEHEKTKNKLQAAMLEKDRVWKRMRMLEGSNGHKKPWVEKRA